MCGYRSASILGESVYARVCVFVCVFAVKSSSSTAAGKRNRKQSFSGFYQFREGERGVTNSSGVTIYVSTNRGIFLLTVTGF